LKILIYGINYAPELVGIGKYTSEMAEWFVKGGHEVRVITAPPYYPYWKVQKPYHAWGYRKESLNRVDIYRCPVWVPNRPSGLKRLIHQLSFSISSFPVFLWSIAWRPDVVIAIEPPLSAVITTGIIARICGFKSWLHIQDYEIDAALSLGFISSKMLGRLAGKVERWIMGCFDRVSSISAAMVERSRSKGVLSERSLLFENWVDTTQIRILGNEGSLRREWRIPKETKVVLYSGNMGRKQGLEAIPKIAKELVQKRPDILFLLVGDGVVRREIKREILVEKLDNVRLMPLQPIEKLSSLLATADVHLVLQHRGAADLVMPSKLGPIFAAGGASLVTADPGTELFKVVHENELGMIVPPENTDAILRGILLLLDSPELRRDYQKRARIYAESKLGKEVILKKFEEKLCELLKG